MNGVYIHERGVYLGEGTDQEYRDFCLFQKCGINFAHVRIFIIIAKINQKKS
jgi:hypothetical protein